LGIGRIGRWSGRPHLLGPNRTGAPGHDTHYGQDNEWGEEEIVMAPLKEGHLLIAQWRIEESGRQDLGLLD
jgi:hypothetical protein